MERKPLSKKTRFEVFKRDNFTCQYCGRKPPDVVLEIDHIIPVSEGGTNDIPNLITSCFDCNRGKGHTRISNQICREDIKSDVSILKEKKEQLQAYYQYQLEMKEILDMNTEIVVDHWGKYGVVIEDSGKASIRKFLHYLSPVEIMEAIDTAVNRVTTSALNQYRYFCGIMWNKIRAMQKQNPVEQIDDE